jgi:phosphate/sulfate permease
VALDIALGFEFVNGFHDTANAVTSVIDKHFLPTNVAVEWSGFFNFLGALVFSGAVAFSIVSSPSALRTSAVPTTTSAAVQGSRRYCQPASSG